MARITAWRGRRIVQADPQATNWLDRMLAKKPVKDVAARMARIVWAHIAREDNYRAVSG